MKNHRLSRRWVLPGLLLAALMLAVLPEAEVRAADEQYHGGSGDGFTLLTLGEMFLNGSTAVAKYYSSSGDGFTVVESVETKLFGIPGDANWDGQLNAADITYIEYVVAMDAGYETTVGCDANEDSNVNALDLTKTELLVA